MKFIVAIFFAVLAVSMAFRIKSKFSAEDIRDLCLSISDQEYADCLDGVDPADNAARQQCVNEWSDRTNTCNTDYQQMHAEGK